MDALLTERSSSSGHKTVREREVIAIITQQGPELLLVYNGIIQQPTAIFELACKRNDEVIAIGILRSFAKSLSNPHVLVNIITNGWCVIYTEYIKLLNIDILDFLRKINAISICCRYGHLELLKIIMCELKPEDLHVAGPGVFPITPLSIVCENGHINILDYMLAHSVDIKAQNCYALKMAVKHKHINIVERILKLECIADIVGENDDVLKPNYILNWVCYNASISIFNDLIKHKLITCDSIRANKYKALILAVRGGSLDIFVNSLIIAGFVERPINPQAKIVAVDLMYPRLIGTGIIREICRYDRLEFLQFFKETFTKLSYKDFIQDNSRTLCIVAANGYLDLLKYIIYIISIPEELLRNSDILFHAITCNHIDIANMLMDHIIFPPDYIFTDLIISTYNKRYYGDIYEYNVSHLSDKMDLMCVTNDNKLHIVEVIKNNDHFDGSSPLKRKALLIAADRGYFDMIRIVLDTVFNTPTLTLGHHLEYYTIINQIITTACMYDNISMASYLINKFPQYKFDLSYIRDPFSVDMLNIMRPK